MCRGPGPCPCAEASSALIGRYTPPGSQRCIQQPKLGNSLSVHLKWIKCALRVSHTLRNTMQPQNSRKWAISFVSSMDGPRCPGAQWSKSGPPELTYMWISCLFSKMLSERRRAREQGRGRGRSRPPAEPRAPAGLPPRALRSGPEPKPLHGRSPPGAPRRGM